MTLYSAQANHCSCVKSTYLKSELIPVEAFMSHTGRACLSACTWPWLRNLVSTVRERSPVANATSPKFHLAQSRSSCRVAAQNPGEIIQGLDVIPLAERQGKVVASASQLHDWREWAREYAADRDWLNIRTGCDDGSPSLDNLMTEVDWIVEDAVAGIRDANGECDGTWRDMGSLLQGNGLPHGGQVLLREDLEKLRSMWVERLLERVPLQYITASCHWRDFIFVVTPAVLIPRPETELMVDFVADALKEKPTLADYPWVDLGTGSGALAIAVAAEISKTKRSKDSAWTLSEGETLVHAVDLSHDAAAVARKNAERNAETTGGGRGGVKVHEGSWYEPLQSIIQEQAESDSSMCFAGIVSNPPYIPSSNMHNLQPEVRNHEPWLALEGGPGRGLDALIPIIDGAAEFLLPGGFLSLETNGGEQARDVVGILRGMAAKNGDAVSLFKDIKTHKDFCGIERFVIARRA